MIYETIQYVIIIKLDTTNNKLASKYMKNLGSARYI